MVHIVVAVLGKATTEDSVTLLSQSTIFLGELTIFCISNWVVRLCARLPLGWVLAGNYCALGSTAAIEVAMLDNASIRGFAVGEVHNSHTLIVSNIELFMLKAQGAVLQAAIAVVEVAVQFACIDNLIGNRLPMVTVIEKVTIQFDICPLKQARDKGVITTTRNALEGVVEVVIIVGKTDRQATDNIGWKVAAIPTPLLFGIALDKGVIDICSNKRYGLLFKILRIFYIPTLALDLLLRLLCSSHAPQLMEGVHIEGEVIEFTLEIGEWRVYKRNKLNNRVYPLPHPLIRGVEDMRTVVMDRHAINILAIEVAANMVSAVDDLDPFTRLNSTPSHHGAEKARADDKVVVRSIIWSAQHSLGMKSGGQGAPTDA